MSEIFSRCSRSLISARRARSMFLQFSRFWKWLRSTWLDTTMPVGICVRRTADEVLLTFWPPAPDERYTSILMSSSRSSISLSSVISGMTSTAANDVCRRPEASNGLMRTRRWMPFSLLRKP